MSSSRRRGSPPVQGNLPNGCGLCAWPPDGNAPRTTGDHSRIKLRCRDAPLREPIETPSTPELLRRNHRPSRFVSHHHENDEATNVLKSLKNLGLANFATLVYLRCLGYCALWRRIRQNFSSMTLVATRQERWDCCAAERRIPCPIALH